MPTDMTAQTATGVSRDSIVVVAPGARYQKSGIGRAVLGGRYRDLWATPIAIPLLNLQTTAGGLVPTKAHSGSQTKSLRFLGGDGREYQFRSVDKDPTARLADDLKHSIAGRLLQDGVSSSHPAASLVASALLQSVGVLHVNQILAMLPDDPALGEFRAEFSGLIGMLEERPDENEDLEISFAGARKVISPTRLFERLDASPDDRVDSRAFLVARLIDIFMGDRDRHRDQFRWVSEDSGDVTYWLPISRDHDEAFVKLDGPVLDVIRMYIQPLISFSAEYPAHDKLNWHSREIDRRFPVDLDRAAWDSVARQVQALLTDEVIDNAVRAMPREMYDAGGSDLATVLRTRRDLLVSEALSYYAFLAENVEVRATDKDEIAEVTGVDGHNIDIVLRERKGTAEPYYRRRFDVRETTEIRLSMWGGKDSVIVRGNVPAGMLLRILGGKGNDVIIDSAASGDIQVYDDHGQNEIVSPVESREINTRDYQEWIGSDLDRYPPRDWGTWWRPLPVLEGSSDLGVVVGAGAVRTAYGFRKQPYASNIVARLAYASQRNALRFELDGDFRLENRKQYFRLQLLASGFELLHYYGQGNTTISLGDRRFHAVQQQVYALEPLSVFPITPSVRWHVGPTVRWSRTVESEDRFLAIVADSLYGAGEFGQVGVRAGFDIDTRDVPANARHGVHIAGEGRVVPGLWDASRAYSSAKLTATAYQSADIKLQPTLAFRIGAQRNDGRYPFQESATVGGQSTVRGIQAQRYAGFASAFASAELRVTVGHTGTLFPALWGAYGGGDVGRVWATETPSGDLHRSVGGGMWIAILDRNYTMRIGAARSTDQNAIYVGAGLPF